MTNQNTHFKGKVVYYTNINGKEQRVEKEFDNPTEYQNFISNNNLQLPGGWDGLWMTNLDTVFEKFFTQKLGNFLGRSALNYQDTTPWTASLWYDDEYSAHLAWYEADLQKLEEEKAKKEARKNYLTGLIEKLKEYKKRFEEAGLKEKLKSVEDDIKNAVKELKVLWS